MDKLKDIFFNLTLTCNACGKENEQGYFCKECQDKIEYNLVFCDKCGRSVINKEMFCNSCQGKVLYFEKARSVFRYTSPISDMILAFKYSGKRYYSKIFADALAYTLLKEFSDTELIVNVPMHIKDRRKRGYNQTELICEQLSKITGYKFVNSLLVKKRRTPRQATLSREERRKNLLDAFEVVDKKAVKDRVVLIVDDCLTTGATIEVLSHKLKIGRASCRERV